MELSGCYSVENLLDIFARCESQKAEVSAIDSDNGNILAIEAVYAFEQGAVATLAHHHCILGLSSDDVVVDVFGRNRTRSELFDIFGELSVYGVIKAVMLYGSEDCVDIPGAKRDAFS